MKYRIVAHWPSEDILPLIEEFETARTAARRYRQLARSSMHAVAIFSIEAGEVRRIAPTRLEKLSLAEPRERQSSWRRTRNTIASAMLGMLASALPNSFGDFGVLSSLGTLRAARSSQRGGRDHHRRVALDAQ